MTGKRDEAGHLQDLVWLRRVRDRIDREYAEPLDVEALAPIPASPTTSGAPSPR